MTAPTSSDPDCIFCKIVAGTIPAQRIYEDEEILVFPDIHPAAPLHLLMIPKAHIVNLYETHARHELLLGRMLALAPRLAREHGASDGFRIVINNGPDGGQEVQHLHIHVLGGPRPWKRF